MADGEIVFGVAGWSYADWKGVVYPRGCKDTLRAVAQRVQLIEINSSFYAPPPAKNSRSWVERTADLGTRFTAKLPHEFTHERAWDAVLVRQMRDGIAPLCESGRLLGLLAQFNHEFVFTADAVAHVASLVTAFRGAARLFVEVRHRSWNADAAMAAMADLGVGVLELDYPGTASGFSRDVTGVHGGGTAYLRLHGRNRAWFVKGAGRDEVYDWRYSATEVAQLGERMLRIAKDGARTLVVANNHFRGNALQVVEDLLAWYRAR